MALRLVAIARNFLYKWYCFFRPVPGWKQRYRQYNSGVKAWEIPGRPDCSKTIPFPVQWIPHTLECKTEEDQKRGFTFIDATCVDTGKLMIQGEGQLCLRCGVPIHASVANICTGFDPPHCNRCKVIIRLFA